MLPMTFTFNSDGFTGLLIDNWPARMVVIATAIALWIVYWRVSLRLRV